MVIGVGVDTTFKMWFYCWFLVRLFLHRHVVMVVVGVWYRSLYCYDIWVSFWFVRWLGTSHTPPLRPFAHGSHIPHAAAEWRVEAAIQSWSPFQDGIGLGLILYFCWMFPPTEHISLITFLLVTIYGFISVMFVAFIRFGCGSLPWWCVRAGMWSMGYLIRHVFLAVVEIGYRWMLLIQHATRRLQPVVHHAHRHRS